jgi:hypothetical protein
MRTALATLLVLAACGGGGDDDAPTMLSAAGGAEGVSGAASVTCSFQLDVIDLVETADGWTGTASGEVFRRPESDTGQFEFSALVGGPATITRAGTTVTAQLVGDQPDDAAPFWLALETLTASETGELAWSGTWTCAPVLPPGDPSEVDIEAAGTWVLTGEPG